MSLRVVPSDSVEGMHRMMVRLRIFEERVAKLLEDGEVTCPTHLYTGQEAVAVGVCAALKTDDYLLGNHRSHGHYLAKGGSADRLMAELFCRSDGCAGGRGGSMHIIDLPNGLLGTVPMVAATIPLAVGTALASQLKGEKRVSIAFFGDSATEEGVFHESVNFAALYKLPIIFVCENNLFSSHLPLERRRPFKEIERLVKGFDFFHARADGNDVLAVHELSKRAVDLCRRGEGPVFLEFATYRWRGHVGPSYDLDVGIRERKELEAWMERDPIKRLEGDPKHKAVMSGAEKVWAEERKLVEASVSFARKSKPPEARSVTDHVYATRGTQ